MPSRGRPPPSPRSRCSSGCPPASPAAGGRGACSPPSSACCPNQPSRSPPSSSPSPPHWRWRTSSRRPPRRQQRAPGPPPSSGPNRKGRTTAQREMLRHSYPDGVSPRAAVRPSAPRERWARAGNVLLVVLVTALQVAGPRAGGPGRAPDLLAGGAGETLGAAAALIGGVALVWRRSRPTGLLG